MATRPQSSPRAIAGGAAAALLAAATVAAGPAAGPGAEARAGIAPPVPAARPEPAAARPSPPSDTLFVPRARTAPTLDCDVGEWSAAGRVSLSGGEPEVLTARGAGGASDLTARVHLSWTRDTLYVMADVRDDRVRPGTASGGDWVRVEVGLTTLWIPAPGGEATDAYTGPRGIGETVPTSVCGTGYGWLAEAAVPADRLGGDLQLGELVGLQVLAEDPDAPGEDAHSPYLRWTEAAVLAAAPEPVSRAEGSLEALRRDVTLEELRGRPGARDTAVRLPRGDTVPAVQVEVGGVEALAFDDPRRGGEVTYWLEGGEESAAESLGLYRTVAALRRQLGEWQAAREAARPAYSDVSFELLPGVVFRLGPPGTADAVAQSDLPTDLFVRTRDGG